MSGAHPEIVIVRRRGGGEEEHHGGAWKIAFADFMTAMMAFFLVLWIISATDKNTKTLIARYFNPVHLEEPARAQKGIHGAPEQNTDSPGQDSKAPKVDKPEPDASEGNAEPTPASGAVEQKAKKPKPDSPIPPDPAKPHPTMTEEELFRDPRASLDKIAGAPPPGPRVDPVATLKGYGQIGPSADEALRDPFRPLGADKAINVASSDPGAASSPAPEATPNPASPPDSGAPAPPEAQPSAPPVGAEAGAALPAAVADAKAAMPDAKAPAADAKVAAADMKSAAASPPSESAIPPLARTEAEPAKPASPPAEAGADLAARLLAEIHKRLGPDAQSVAGPQLDIRATDEGVLISLTDRQNFAMFALGSAEPQRRVVKMMEAIAMSLETLPGSLIVRGHTDAHPYRSGTYDNWRLSAARAQMAYYMLNRAGIAEKRFDRIEGFADHRLKDPIHPLAAENRRIEVLVRETKP